MESTLTTEQKPKRKMTDRRALVIALILGAVAAGLIIAYLSNRDAEAKKTTVPTLSVVVAAQDIAAGEKITEAMVAMKAVPEAAVGRGTATSATQVVGQTVRYPIAQGEQLNPVRLVESPKAQALSFHIPGGLRAFTVPVSTNNTPAALIVPGDFVDVLVAGPSKALGLADPSGGGLSGRDPKAATTLLQNIQVLSVQRQFVSTGAQYDETVRGEVGKPETITFVTLALVPENAQTLWLAMQDGKVTLTLRAFGDAEIKSLEAVYGQ